MEIRRVIVVFSSDPGECDLRAGGSCPNATTESSADDRQHSFGQNANGNVEDKGENPDSFQVLKSLYIKKSEYSRKRGLKLEL